MLPPESTEAKFLNRLAAVIITGGSSGIGNEFLKAITTVCPQSVICNLSRTKPANFPLGENHHHLACDLNDTAALPALAGQIRTLLENAPAGPLLLINNSGFGAYGRFPEPELARYEAMITVNVLAPVKLTGLLWPVLQQRTGWVLNVASIGAFQPTPFMGVYGATKAFLLHWSLALNTDGKKQGIRALAVCPGATRSAFFHNAGYSDTLVPGGKQTPEAVVRESLRALARGKTQVVTGWVNKLSAFFSARLPKPWSTHLAYLAINKLRMQKLREQGGE